jgi:hypothetical protein
MIDGPTVYVVTATSIEQPNDSPYVVGVYLTTEAAQAAAQEYRSHHLALVSILNGVLYQPHERRRTRRRKAT